MLTGAFANIPTMGRRSPFNQLNLLKRQMDLLSDAMFHRVPMSRLLSSGVFPAINLTEDGQNYYLRAEMPGIRSGDIEVQVVGRNLTLSGERKIASEGEDVRYHRREREAGRFSRVIGLPGDIDSQKVNAKLNNGLLEITIAKSESAKPRTITVK